MSRNRDQDPYATEAPGYISPTEGYVPAQPRGASNYASGADDLAARRNLDRFYSGRMRWLRVRWFSCGLLLGLVSGIAFTLGAAILLAKQLPALTENVSGQPDVAVIVSEGYLNRQAELRIDGGYATGVSQLTLTSLRMDLQPENKMVLQPTFRVDLGFTSVDLNATVTNQLSVQDGRLAINMVGDPQLGSFDIPLDLLPFDLNKVVAQAIDNVNNNLLLSEINQYISSNLGNSGFVLQSTDTSDTDMTLRLTEK